MLSEIVAVASGGGAKCIVPMSAFPPEAVVGCAARHFRVVPGADIPLFATIASARKHAGRVF